MVEPNRTEAVVEYDYTAHESDELTLRKGDIITDIRMQPGGWWEGTLAGKRGMFPDNFVKVVNESGSKKDTPSSDSVPLRPAGGRRCKVLFSYQPVNEDELALQVNDVIDILGEVEEGWWKGKLRENVGVFPSNFVLEIKDQALEENHSPAAMTSSQKSRSSSREDASESDGELSTSVSSPDSSQLLDRSDHDADAPILPPKPVKEVCRVLFPYDAVNEDELTLREGDLVTLVSREVADKGWWRGELRGKVGVFPDNFVEVVQQEEQPKKPERPPAKSQSATSTNRIRDTITKPSPNRPETTEAAVRKSLDLPPKPDDKSPTAVPPIPGKKPQLPPPIKKPQRTSHGHHGGDMVDGGCHSRAARHKEEVHEFDSVERSAMLIHPTASRAKAPRRRLPTTIHGKDSEVSTGLMNGTADGGHHNDLDSQEPVRGSRLWEKNKVPWVDELKSMLGPKRPSPQQEPGNSRLSSTPPSAASVNDSSSSTPPSEVTPRQTPTGVALRHHGPTRAQSLFSGDAIRPQSRPFSSAGSGASLDQPRPPPTSPGLTKPSGTSLDHQKSPSTEPASVKPSSGLAKSSGASVDHPRPPSMEIAGIKISPGHPKPSGASLDHPRPPSTEPLSARTSPSMPKPSATNLEHPRPPSTEPPSMRTSPGMAKPPGTNLDHPRPPSTEPVSAKTSPSMPKPSAISPLSMSSFATTTQQRAISPDVTDPDAVVPHKQYLELKEKVVKLEQCLEEQKQCFTKALKEVMEKLNEEISRRIQMEQDLDKLTNLVTQV